MTLPIITEHFHREKHGVVLSRIEVEGMFYDVRTDILNEAREDDWLDCILDEATPVDNDPDPLDVWLYGSEAE